MQKSIVRCQGLQVLWFSRRRLSFFNLERFPVGIEQQLMWICRPLVGEMLRSWWLSGHWIGGWGEGCGASDSAYPLPKTDAAVPLARAHAIDDWLPALGRRSCWSFRVPYLVPMVQAYLSEAWWPGGSMSALWDRFVRDESGQGLVEYALIIALVAIGLIAILTLLRNSIGNVFNESKNRLNAAPGTAY